MAAKEQELLDYPHGDYPFVPFEREMLTGRMWDSRGIPELVGTDQAGLKLLDDSYSDHAQLNAVPPIKVPMKRPKHRIVIGPLKQIKENRPGEVSWMKPAATPTTNERQKELIQRRIDEYFGRRNPEVAEQLWQLHTQGTVDDFLESAVEALIMVVKLCKKFMPKDEVVRILGEVPWSDDPKEIRGDYDLEMTYDVRNMDMNHIKALAETLQTSVLPMDSTATVMRDKLVSEIFQAISPTFAEGTLQPQEKANEREADDERSMFAQIAAGIEPTFVVEGQNHALRLQVLAEIQEKNPESTGQMTRKSKEILLTRIQQHQHQVQQQQNAVIGRTGAAPALAQKGRSE
jgi:hypothetical protein